MYHNWIEAQDEGTDQMKEIAGHVKLGAMAYLTQQYKIVGIVFACLFVILLGLVFIKNIDLFKYCFFY